MIYECLVAPTESPNSLLEVKRALLTYDKVKLIDPSDRDVMPSNAYMSTVLGMPLFGMDMGAVRPMGKVLGYDDIFEKIIDTCKPAIQQGLIEVISTYDIPKTKGSFTIGGVPTGGYPLNTQFVFWLYRSMAQDQNFLTQAISGSKNNLINNAQLSSELALKGVGDGGINDIPALPMINDDALSKEENECLTQIARARLAATIKYAGFCEMKELVPVFNSSVYGNIVSGLLNNAHSVFADIEDDQFWLRRNRVLELCHEEYLDETILESMSIEQVIKLRSKAWGTQAASRDSLFSSIAEIALELDSNDLFQGKAKHLVNKYRKESEALVSERQKVHFQIKCELGKATLGGGTALIGLLSQLSSPMASMGLTLAAGGMWAFDKSKVYVPALNELKNKELELKRGAGFGLHGFYSRLK
jgi:hypothetical protein